MGLWSKTLIQSDGLHHTGLVFLTLLCSAHTRIQIGREGCIPRELQPDEDFCASGMLMPDQ